jgi:hypothetical protein
MPNGKNLSEEDKIVIFFTLLALLGGVGLYFVGAPPIMVSVFLSAGITSLAYRFLGGIQGAEFHIGALKMGGAIAVLIGVAWWMNSLGQFYPKYCGFHLLSEDELIGRWNWKALSPGTGFDGYLDFERKGSKFTFTGEEHFVEATDGGKERDVPFLQLSNGTGEVSSDLTTLSLESDVQDLKNNRTFHWKSVQPLVIIPAFDGQFWPQPGAGGLNPNLTSHPWGVLITKVK